MKKVFLDLNDIKSAKSVLASGTICEFQSPVKVKGCPTQKNLNYKGNFIDLQTLVGEIKEIDGKKVLIVKKMREGGFIQKNPKFIVVI